MKRLYLWLWPAFFLSLLLPNYIRANKPGDSTQSSSYKKLYKLDTFRALQGTIQFCYETKIKKNWTCNIGFMGTYASTKGLAKPYLKAQSFSYLDKDDNSAYSLNDLEMLGYGINIQFRKYLGKAGVPLKAWYIAPELFFRHLNLLSTIIDNHTQEPKDINRKLFLGYAGYVVGYQKILLEIICIDAYLGGGFFYSQYADENKPVHYHSNYQIDYTGIFINSGVLIGITH